MALTTGLILALRWKTFYGSYFCLMRAKRSYF